jgi:hypothetical protein
MISMKDPSGKKLEKSAAADKKIFPAAKNLRRMALMSSKAR